MTVGRTYRGMGKDSSRVALGVATAVLLLASGPIHGQGQPPTPPEHGAPPASGYVIGPRDVLEIVVWKEPDLTREVTVRVDGMVTLPLLGDLEAAGRAPAQLAESLARALERYIEGPRVAVVVKEATSIRFYVVGEVTSPGEYPLSGGTTVLQALALAGGFKEFAKRKEIVVIREGGAVIPFDFEKVAEGKQVSQNILLEPGDTIVVP